MPTQGFMDNTQRNECGIIVRHPETEKLRCAVGIQNAACLFPASVYLYLTHALSQTPLPHPALAGNKTCIPHTRMPLKAGVLLESLASPAEGIKTRL